MEISDKELYLLSKLIADPSLLVFLVSMAVVAFALFIVYKAIKPPKD
jgi:hypothetical protein